YVEFHFLFRSFELVIGCRINRLCCGHFYCAAVVACHADRSLNVIYLENLLSISGGEFESALDGFFVLNFESPLPIGHAGGDNEQHDCREYDRGLPHRSPYSSSTRPLRARWRTASLAFWFSVNSRRAGTDSFSCRSTARSINAI